MLQDTRNKVLVPLPDHGFDVSEVAVPWRLLSDAGYDVVFATEHARPPSCDELLLAEDLWGRVLGASKEARTFYWQMAASREFSSPIRWDQVKAEDFAGLLLPGGHAPGMRQYLESPVLQTIVTQFCSLPRPVGAICHGVVLMARSTDRQTGKSVLFEKRTTCLPKYMERASYALTFWRLGRHYRTYPLYVEDEVRGALQSPRRQFERGPITLGKRGSRNDSSPSFTVRDGNYLSARWPGDAFLFAKQFAQMLNSSAKRGT